MPDIQSQQGAGEHFKNLYNAFSSYVPRSTYAQSTGGKHLL